MTTSNPQVLLETESFMALNKPFGWVINESKTAHGNLTVQSFIKKNFSFPVSQNDELRNGIVHRLDKDTSGVLLVAKTEEAFELLQKQFFERTVQKSYLTLVHGELRGGGKINAPIGRNPINRRHFTVLPDGRDAETWYEVKNVFKKNNEVLSLLEVRPKTGRTHQIRVHLKHIHHPVVSDPLYVGRKTLRDDISWCPRLFLHAYTITFTDPKTMETVSVKSELPSDLSSVLESLV